MIESNVLDLIEAATQHALGLQAPLAEKLASVARRITELDPRFAAAVERFITRATQAGAGGSAPKPGVPMPSFRLPNQHHQLVALWDLLEKGPVAIIVIRGHWCPYCRVQIADIASVLEDAAPLQFVFLSAETQGHAAPIRSELGGRGHYLCDTGAGYLLSLGLALWVEDAVAAMLADMGLDVPTYQNGTGWVVPIPALFLVGQDGIIRARHVDPDYRRRFDVRASLPWLKQQCAIPPDATSPPRVTA